MLRLLLPLFLALAPAFAGDEVPARKAGETEGGVLYRYGDRRVLVVRGAPRAMGLAHGRLLAPEIEANVRAFLHQWALGRMGRTRAELQAIWDAFAPHLPRRYHEELAGLAEGAGVPLADLRLMHALPSRYHCTGTAALPAVTKDGKVYHTRSLDYALDIGDTVRPQTNSILLVAVPDDAIPHAIVGWAGFLGCVTGLNLAGVSVGEMGSRSQRESYAGVPMIFLLREVLGRAKNLQAAQAIWRKGPRTCGFNFIFCDEDEICAVECDRDAIRFFGPGDEAENVAPHSALEGIVRRCNHFVDKDLAAQQRDGYDPRKTAASSWQAYARQGAYLDERRGRIDAAVMIEVLRGYPATHPCLHQAVMCPNDRLLWVSQAKDPATDPLAGAQNQVFLRYDLRALVSGSAPPAPRFRTDRSVPKGAASGVVADAPRIPEPLGHEPKPFRFTLEPVRTLSGTTIGRLTFPSAGPSRHPENLTVHAEYYQPEGAGPFPAAMVLHILDGRFYAARLIASSLAQRGVAALMIKLPYYGERRPPQAAWEEFSLEEVTGGFVQAVRDVRRGAAWLRARPEVDGKQVGIAGVSLGSFVAQLAAGADGGFHRCAFVLGGGSITDAVYNGSRDTRKMVAYAEQRGWSRADVARAFAPFEPVALAGGIARESVLMINCRHDEVVPAASVERYWEALRKPEIRWYDGGHYALKSRMVEVLEAVVRHLGAR